MVAVARKQQVAASSSVWMRSIFFALNSIFVLGTLFTLPLLIKTGPSEGAHVYSVMLKFFGSNFLAMTGKKACSPKTVRFRAPDALGPQVPTRDPFWPMGVIHPVNGFHYGFLRRVISFQISDPHERHFSCPFCRR